ncbi:hypothetical protein QQY66_47980 [Streptomyces sp. DG2A-72]|uniref:hypothetical protein n=1 Tax=Streptomyces sp. DG2A-72 TaxID=3051386 RepID=UPI00265BC083|nr:hypothetical protein [Streptomyces sp. DG2A-72]MDO0939077.1 hypothetical protein [Streptomyces sp. DG2A-72]
MGSLVRSDGGGTDPGADETARPGMSYVQRRGPEAGEILVDKQGCTLYRCVKDTDWPMTTACTDECLEKWKPAK